jgi:hypothetical protein
VNVNNINNFTKKSDQFSRFAIDIDRHQLTWKNFNFVILTSQIISTQLSLCQCETEKWIRWFYKVKKTRWSNTFVSVFNNLKKLKIVLCYINYQFNTQFNQNISYFD